MSREPTASEPPLPIAEPVQAGDSSSVPAQPSLGTIEYAPVFDERRLHPATIIVQAVRFLRRMFFLLIIIVVTRMAGQKADTVEIIASVIGGLSVVGAVFKYISVRFSIRDGALHYSGGLIERQRRTIPLERIQNINIKQELIHRLLGVADVRIETASGGDAEAELSVVSLADAQAIRAVLTGAARPKAEQTTIRPEELYHASLWHLILAGATQNRLGTLLAGVAGIIVFFNSVAGSQSRALAKLGERLSRAAHMPGWTTIVLLVLGAILIGWLASMAFTVFGRYGFALTRTGGQLHRSFGLTTRHESLFPVERVQVLRVIAPLLQRWAGLCRVNVETAGSFKEGEKQDSGTNELCPIIPRKRVGEICRLVMAEFRPDEIVYQPMHPLARRRAFVRIAAITLFLTVPLALWLSAWIWLTLIATLPLGWVLAGIYYRSVGYCLNEWYFITREGIWTQTIEVVPLTKMQATFVKQSPLQRRLGLATFELITAGGINGNAVSVPDLGRGRALQIQETVAAANPIY